MSAFPLALPSLNTTLIPPEDPAMLTGSSTATLTPGIGASNEISPLSTLAQNIEDSIPGVSTVKAVSAGATLLKSWFGARGVVLILGLMLIAAGLFSLNPVKEKIILAGKTAAAAAA